MKKILLLSICFISIHAFGQMLNTNKVWNDLDVKYPICKSSECLKAISEVKSTISYHLGNDSIINAMTYNSLIDSNYSLNYSDEVEVYGSEIGFVREDTAQKKVFFLPENSTQEALIYDFSLSVGNKFFLKTFYYNDTLNVVSRDSIIYSGHKRLVITLNNDYASLNWIEDIGSIQGFLYYYNTFGSLDSNLLLCVKANDETVYQNNKNYSCFYFKNTINAIDESSAQPGLKLFPNPAHDNLTIVQNEIIGSIEILDVYGRKLTQYYPGRTTYSISLTGLQKGIYFIKVDAFIKKLLIE